MLRDSFFDGGITPFALLLIINVFAREINVGYSDDSMSSMSSTSICAVQGAAM
jgi:hypothetical protein